MDPRLLSLYNEELGYLREGAREFGEEHETVAARLGLKTPSDPDPYVERLLEGVAFLGARVQLKIRDQYPEFTQHLLHAIQPVVNLIESFFRHACLASGRLRSG